MRNADLTQDQKWDAIQRAVEAGDICGECFDWIPPNAPVMVVSVPRARVWELTRRWDPKQVTICLDCAHRAYSLIYDIAKQYQCRGCGAKFGNGRGGSPLGAAKPAVTLPSSSTKSSRAAFTTTSGSARAAASCSSPSAPTQ
jgi:hypothetical protein